MELQAIIDKVTECAESIGFSVNTYIDELNRHVDFEFNTDTHFGQDFYATCRMEDNDPDTLVQSVYDYWQGYDPDEEASLWIGPDGHGKNGAPYRITDIVKDMEECESRLEELYDALSKIDFYHEDEE